MQSEWWRGAIIYQIYPRSFYDSNHDGTGDLSGIRAKLDYVASLGVDAIWISPFFKSPMRDFGYDVSDYRKVDPIFGSNADFNALVEAAHERGLKVIIDMVLAHTSDQHAWFQESRQNRTNSKADWYVGLIPIRTVPLQITGYLFSEDLSGSGRRVGGSIIFTTLCEVSLT